ncbi:ABC transporter substrate-binding protein [Cryobacterium glaciale]|uniref:ABC transporter substrate-binding protein n=1 Tax=Cryobacterium glaciale TaxID=1259145 RepID=A0A4R8V245_9MICO|nr:ABC transporter substrate-binding protein [Cryobacterium glaciale]TFB75015.1 ABC transporter substrate-binding protein [Cryobacterium glaciale]
MTLAACSTGSGTGADPDSTAKELTPERISIVIPAESALFWDIYVAEAEGFFDEFAVEAEITLTPGPAATLAALVGGAADVGTPFAEQGLAAIEKGAPLSIFAGQSNTILVSIVGSPGFEDADSLRGQKVASSNVDDTATILLEEWLEDEGADPDDIDKIIVGSSGQRYQALQSGAVVAATLTAPTDQLAIRSGFPLIEEISLPGVLTAHFGTDSFLENRPHAAVRYTKAIQKAVDWLLDPANKERAIEILVERAEVDQVDAEMTYDLYLSEDVFIAGSPIELELVGTALGYLEKTNRVEGSPDPADYVTAEILTGANE